MSQASDGAKAPTETTDSVAVDSLVQSCLPSVQQWAHGRLPSAARGEFDTVDLVQEAALRMLKRGRRFEPRHAFAVRAYLRQIVLNLIRDKARRLMRRGESVELCEDVASDQSGPVEFAERAELRAYYEAGLRSLRPRDRRLVIAKLQEERKPKDIAREFGLSSPDAARMAVTRALRRLMRKLERVK